MAEDTGEPIGGLRAALAKEIIKLGGSDAVPNSEKYWTSFIRLKARVYATARS